MRVEKKDFRSGDVSEPALEYIIDSGTTKTIVGEQ